MVQLQHVSRPDIPVFSIKMMDPDMICKSCHDRYEEGCINKQLSRVAGPNRGS